MSALAWAAAGAFWLGILTSISPCLLATNVTAISFLARRVSQVRLVWLASAAYIAGQSLAFVALAALLLHSVLSLLPVAHALQTYMFRLLGPVLLVCAVFLLDLMQIQWGSGRLKGWAQGHAQAGGPGAAALLGIVFAMSFCPTTAALFFGSLLPLATAHGSTLLLPACYAVGVALPVLVFSLLVAHTAHWVAAAYARVGQAERWARRATGVIFLAVGVYFTLRYTLGFF